MRRFWKSAIICVYLNCGWNQFSWYDPGTVVVMSTTHVVVRKAIQRHIFSCINYIIIYWYLSIINFMGISLTYRWSAPSWPDSSTGRALHRHCRCQISSPVQPFLAMTYVVLKAARIIHQKFIFFGVALTLFPIFFFLNPPALDLPLGKIISIQDTLFYIVPFLGSSACLLSASSIVLSSLDSSKFFTFSSLDFRQFNCLTQS